MGIFSRVEPPLPPPYQYVCLPCHNQFGKKATGMSVVATYWPYIASIIHDIMGP